MLYEEVARLLSLMFDPVPYFALIEDPATKTVIIRMPDYAWAIAGDAIRIHLS